MFLMGQLVKRTIRNGYLPNFTLPDVTVPPVSGHLPRPACFGHEKVLSRKLNGFRTTVVE
jgi:hypothetical protein